jgi:hypothetical protein
MPLPLYEISVPALRRGLTNLSHILNKAADDAAARQIDPAALLHMRLYPDMHPMVRHAQYVTDGARNGAGKLAGIAVTDFPYTETSFAQLQDRIQRSLLYIESAPAAQIDNSEERKIDQVVRGTPQVFSARSYLMGFVLPNLYFHSTVVYSLLRHCGVPLGKRDFLGSIESQ